MSIGKPFRPVTEALERMRAYKQSFWVTGGWALSLFLNQRIRAHSDVDILVLLRDVDKLRTVFPDLLLQSPNTGERSPWPFDAELVAGRDALVWDAPDKVTAGMQIVLARSDEHQWVYHRGNGSTRKPLNEVTLFGVDNVPYLAPEIVLLLKSRQLREKDTEDFLAVLHALDAERRAWLITQIEPFRADHPWLPRLDLGV
jgi:hypothetical protein